MNNIEQGNVSKFMSLILRHKPEKFHIKLDPEGYTLLDDLLQAIQKNWHGSLVTKEHILKVVKTCNKQRFEMKDDYIRARYGHSKQNIQYEAKTPPAVLIHGTHQGAISSILQTGIKKMERDYVHSSETLHFATLAGKRRGKVAYFLIDTKAAMKQNILFYYAGDEVWLSDDIPPSCIKLQS